MPSVKQIVTIAAVVLIVNAITNRAAAKVPFVAKVMHG